MLMRVMQCALLSDLIVDAAIRGTITPTFTLLRTVMDALSMIGFDSNLTMIKMRSLAALPQQG